MPTLILTPRFTEDAQVLWRTAAEMGWNVERLNSWRVPDDLRTVPEPVLYLEALMGPTLAEQFGLRLIEPAVDWLPTVPFEFRKRTVSLSTLGQARSLRQPFFIKPPNDKSFPAAVYVGQDLPSEFPDEMPVLVSEVVVWEKEFRCFILNRKLRTFSIYLRHGELQRENGFQCTESEASEVTDFVERLLSDGRVQIGRTAVIDVGVMSGLGWGVVEQNAAWGSGIYGCDPAEVLEVIRHSMNHIDTGLAN